MGILKIHFFSTVSVLSIIFVSLAARKIKNSDSEESLESESDYAKYTKTFDLRGSLRQNFGLQAFLTQPDRSGICSPISALLPLGKLALGAQDKTLKELNNAIGVSSDISSDEDKPSDKLKKHLKSLVKDLERLPGVILDVANRIYISDKHSLYSNYAKIAKKIFKFAVKQVNFEDSNKVSSSINSWVSSETHGMIPHIIKPADISPLASLVIVNAVYFAGKWKHPFPTVSLGPFHSPNGIRNIPMMTEKNVYDYDDNEVLSAQVVKIPYEGEKASFMIVLPKGRNGLQHLMNRLKNEPHLLAQSMKKMKKTKLKLTIPKFKIESEWNLVTLYKKIGLSRIFKVRKSELKGIVRNETLHVSTAIQKAVIDVNELGTEASAASVITNLASAMMTKKEFTADHPFLFYVMANSQQLFTGTFI